MKEARQPFQFTTASYLTRICNLRAISLDELSAGLRQCSDASIFYHAIQTLGRHHFLTEGFSNDFAHWASASANQAELAEQLSGIDIRDYLSLADLRTDVRRMVDDYCGEDPAACRQVAFEPFFFCESVEFALPIGQARTLQEFRSALDGLSHTSLYFHFISARLRLQLRTNDFSLWFAESLGLEDLARRTNEIDIYTNTLDDVRDQLASLVEGELAS